MATKLLSDLIGGGGGGREVGDVIETRASVLSDGKVLVPMDGRTITPATYPLLEALLDPVVTASHYQPYISADGSSVDDNTSLPRIHKCFVNDAGTIVATVDDDHDYWFQDAAAAAQVGSWAIANENYVGPVVGAADGNELFYTVTGFGVGLQIEYTLNGDTPFTNLDVISGGDTHDQFMGAYCSKDGANARITCINSTDSAIDTLQSGANIGTGWSLLNQHIYTITPGAELTCSDSSDDFATIACGEIDGLWCTFNSGATWTEQIAIPNEKFPAPLELAVDDLDNVWVINTIVANATGDRLYKTTNGTSFTEVLNVVDAIALLPDGRMKNVGFKNIFTDSSNNLYLVGYGRYGESDINTSHFLDAIIVWYSEDAGVTWSGNVVSSGMMPFTSASEALGQSIWEFKMSPNCTTLILAGWSTIAGFRYMDITTGLALPLLPGKKIVADAP